MMGEDQLLVVLAGAAVQAFGNYGNVSAWVSVGIVV